MRTILCIATYLKGEKIFAGGEVLSEPRGEILLSG